MLCRLHAGAASLPALRPLRAGYRPEAVAITPSGRTVYATNYTTDVGRGTVTVIRNCP